MKKLYILTTLFIYLFAFIQTGLSQSYSGGIYTAVRTGNWHTPSGINAWDISGEPPSLCNNCLITINSGVVITLNTDILLTGNSKITVGSDNSAPAGVVIAKTNNNPPSPAVGPLPISGHNRIDMQYGQPAPVDINLRYTSSYIDASNTLNYDGIYLYVSVGSPNTSPYEDIKRMGKNSSIVFPSNTTSSISGPATLTSDGTLPIVLTNFNALFSDNVTQLTWTTDLEINSSKFVILRSGDGNTWTSIGTVSAKGNSTLTTDYSFIDPSPLHGINYYRLKEIDISQNFKLSDIQLIHGGLIKGIRFINPAKSNLQITFGSDIISKVTLRLLSLSGQVLQMKQVNNPAGETIPISIGNYSNGIYMLHVISTNGTQNIFKVVVNN
jgi:hypothetical protein